MHDIFFLHATLFLQYLFPKEWKPTLLAIHSVRFMQESISQKNNGLKGLGCWTCRCL